MKTAMSLPTSFQLSPSSRPTSYRSDPSHKDPLIGKLVLDGRTIYFLNQRSETNTSKGARSSFESFEFQRSRQIPKSPPLQSVSSLIKVDSYPFLISRSRGSATSEDDSETDTVESSLELLSPPSIKRVPFRHPLIGLSADSATSDDDIPESPSSKPHSPPLIKRVPLHHPLISPSTDSTTSDDDIPSAPFLESPFPASIQRTSKSSINSRCSDDSGRIFINYPNQGTGLPMEEPRFEAVVSDTSLQPTARSKKYLIISGIVIISLFAIAVITTLAVIESRKKG